MSGPARQLGFVSSSDAIGAADLELVAIEGREELSRLYEYQLSFESDLEHGLDETLQNALLKAACSIDYSPDQNAPTHGVLRSLTMLPYQSGRPVRYHGVFVPRLWRLTLTRASRVFQDASVPGIVIGVLRMHGLKPSVDFDVRFQAADFPKLSYCVQYEESDFDFISRLLEEHGLFYVFEQTADAERVVLTDHNGGLPELGRPLSYATHPTGAEHDDALQDIYLTRRVTPEEVHLRSYRSDAAEAPVAHEVVDKDVGYGVMRFYGESVEDEATIKARTKVRAQALRVRGATMRASPSALGLPAGSRLPLGDHPPPEPNGEYYVLSMKTNVAVRDELEQGGELLRQELEAVPFEVPYRAEARTAQPKVEGIVYATVDGDVLGAAAPIDDDGSYRVVLPFDAVAKAGGRATRAIKRAQPSAGKDSGMHFPLHIGSEVVISHVDGDPDRPIIIGAVPNVANQSPVTAADGSKNRIRTRSGVLIEIDDATG